MIRSLITLCAVVCFFTCCGLYAQTSKEAYKIRTPNFLNSVATVPDVVTLPATSVGATVATLQGSVDPQGSATNGWFQWGLSPTLTDSTAKQSMGNGNGSLPLSQILTGLIPNTPYVFRAVGKSSDGTTFGSTLGFTTLPLTRDSIIARVISQIITPSPYKNSLIAFLYNPSGPESTLTAGYTLTTPDSTAIYSVSGNKKWFVWIDLTGDIRFAHPCQFVLVDAVTASLQVYNVDWWPVVKPPSQSPAEVWSSIEERYKDSTSIFYGHYSGTAIPGVSTPKREIKKERGQIEQHTIFYKTQTPSSGNTCGILVGGAAISKGETNAWQNDLDSMRNAFTTPPPGGGNAMVSEAQVKNNATQNDVQTMIDTAVAHGCNSILFYYSGHGSRASGGALYLNGGRLPYSTLATMLNKGVTLKFKNVILDDCYGGISGPRFQSKPIPVTILTASDSTKTSSGSVTFIDKNGDGKLNDGDSITTGQGAYTDAWIKCWRKLRDSLQANPTLKQIHDWVLKVNPDSIKQKQNPQYIHILPPVVVSRTINGPGFYDFTGTGVSMMFNSVGGPFMVTVSHYFQPIGGTICPGDTILRTLSTYDYWDIQQLPQTPFIANVCFQYDSTVEGIPTNGLRLATRPDQFQCLSSYPSATLQGPCLTAGSVTHFSQWTFASATLTTLDILFNLRWNLVSVPVQTNDLRRTTLFPTSVSSAYSYNHAYVQKDTLAYCSGFWLKFPSAQTVSITGDVVNKDTCPIIKGWNLVGSISYPVSVNSVSTIPNTLSLSSFYGYNNGYYIVDSIKPGKGYWLKTSDDGELVLTKPPFAVPRSAARGIDFSNLNSLSISDADGESQTLFFGDETNLDGNFELEAPPLPIHGVFDARFASGQFIQTYPKSIDKQMEFPIQLSSATYPMRVEWNIIKQNSVSYSLPGRKDISGKGSILLKAGTPLSLIVQRGELPQRFALLQNYPNPFNPSTTVMFEVPEVSKVNLKVYNVLGQIVASLIDNKQISAGEHSVAFDAVQFGSGVYFVRMTAEKVGPRESPNSVFSDMKKMLLIK